MNDELTRSGKLGRWVSREPDADGHAEVDERIGIMLRQVPEADPLSPARLSAIESRLSAHPVSGVRRFRMAAVGLLFIVGTGAVFAREQISVLASRVMGTLSSGAPATIRRAPRRSSEKAATRPVAPAALDSQPHDPLVSAVPVRPSVGLETLPAPGRRSVPAPSLRSPRLSLTVPEADLPVVTAPVVPVASVAPPVAPVAPPVSAPLRAAPPVSAPSAPALVVNRPLGDEARLMARAVKSLRVDRNATAALEALDEYRKSFPQGVLLSDASLVRVDALVALNRTAEALAVLESLSLEHLAGAAERLIQRGELRLRAGSLRAVGDLDRALSMDLPVALEMRALEARTRANLRMGDVKAALADCRRYLDRFPLGPFAAAARLELSR